MRRMVLLSMLGLLTCAVPVAVGADPTPAPATQPVAAPAAQPMWMNHVEPIFNKSCFKCHGTLKQKGGLDLRQPQTIFDGGTDGSVVIPGRPGESPLYQRIQAGAKDHMPPDDAQQLSAEEVSFVQQWIATLPTTPANHPPITGSGIDWNQSAPSLMDMATRTKWEAPAGMQPSDAIDLLIQKHWQEQHVTGNGVCDDRTFVRRIYLDLAGRIPTHAEADAFVNTADSKKREMLVDQLLAGDEYPRHLADVLDVSLMERKGPKVQAERISHGWLDYLSTSIAKNRPWNEMVAELVSARPTADNKGAVWFLYEKKNNYQQMAEAVAPVAFGVSIACAQCHNHPLAHEIKQQNYWGLVAAFNRSNNAETRDGVALTESAVGGFVSFTNLKKESQPAILTLLNDQTIDEKRPADGAKEQDSDGNYIVPPSRDKGRSRIAAVPKFSRRQAVADAVTHNNPLLARAFVNRMWGLLLGRGIVNPVDQMDSRHLPSHPELLAYLSADFEQSGYDIKHLIREIVLSRTYQLDSRWNQSIAPAPELFARGLDKPLPAEVLYRSLLVATGHDQPAGQSSADHEALRRALVTNFPGLFDVEYNATLQQAMFLTNNPSLDELLKPADQDLTDRLLKLPANDERARAVFVEVLGRQPDDEERARAVAFLDKRSDRPEAGVRQLAWTLLTSAEFLLNH